MVCPECNGRGEAIYYVETDRDENTVTVEQRKGICRTCNGSGEKQQTNADRIRSMSDEELADFLESTHSNLAIKLSGEYIVREKEYIGIWLKQPAEK